MNVADRKAEGADAGVYDPGARRLHWWTVVLVAIMLPLGFAMSYRGNTLDIWDGRTDAMYSLHKLIGFVLLWLVVYRLIRRFRVGAPPDEPTLEWWQKLASHVTHWSLYGLLILVPLMGWLGVSLYGARTIFNFVSLPALAAQDQEAAARVLALHGLLAKLTLLLIAAHIGAAMFHHVIRKDNVLRRMLPRLPIR